MLEYKVCFHMSYHQPYSVTHKGELILPKKWHGKMHYCGATLEEAVAKVRYHVANYEARHAGTCTSMWIMRGKEKGKNIKWTDYHRRGATKELWQKALTFTLIAQKETEKRRARIVREHYQRNY